MITLNKQKAAQNVAEWHDSTLIYKAGLAKEDLQSPHCNQYTVDWASVLVAELNRRFKK